MWETQIALQNARLAYAMGQEFQAENHFLHAIGDGALLEGENWNTGDLKTGDLSIDRTRWNRDQMATAWDLKNGGGKEEMRKRVVTLE